MQNTIPVVAVTGPTASGKTALAARLAEHFGGEVVSADSIQIYEGMDIASAKPTPEEMLGIPHHMLSFLPPQCEYSVAEYVSLASRVIGHIRRRGKNIIIAGGTGLYIDSLLSGIRFSEVSPDNELRRRLREQAEKEGSGLLHDMLCEYDANAAQRINPNDAVRLIRAIEAYLLSGKTAAVRAEESKLSPSAYRAFYIGLYFHDRQRLYDRINSRVDAMAEAGLADEAEYFLKKGISKTAMNAIGYKELMPFIAGEAGLDECVGRIKQDTRRYAKRQLTWFRRNKSTHWIDVQDKTAVEIFEEARQLIQETGFLS